LGILLDKGLMKITCSRWQKKSRNRKLNRRGIVMGMDAGKHYAKPDPEHFQKKIMEVYEKNLYHLFQNYENKVKTTY
jgi:hypothetical protein